MLFQKGAIKISYRDPTVVKIWFSNVLNNTPPYDTFGRNFRPARFTTRS